MRRNAIHNTDLEISQMTVGTWLMGGDKMWGAAEDSDSVSAIHAAVDMGVNIIDTAPIYGNGHSEDVVGRALKGKSKDILVATKCGLLNEGGRIRNWLAPDSIRREVELSLARLGRDRIDICQCHWPDKDTPLEETMAALVRLRDEGKIRHIGVSNFPVELLEKACSLAPVISEQSQFSLLHRVEEEAGVLEACIRNKVGFLAYGPLGGGILTGKYKTPPSLPKMDARSFFYPFYKEPLWSRVLAALEKAKAFAEAKGRSLHEIILCATAATEGVTSLIVGCRNKAQARQNAAAFAAGLEAGEIEEVKSFFAGIGAD